MRSLLSLSVSLLLLPATLAVSISEINGDRFLSPYNGKTVSDVRGLVTAKGSSGFYIRSTKPDNSSLTSESLYVYDSNVASKVSVGDIITLGGTVSEHRSKPAYVYLTELTSPSDVKVVSSDNEVVPLVIGLQGLKPPTEQFSALDDGDIFGVPNNKSQISAKNDVLQPTKYGMDFWESLSGELVTIGGLNAVTKPNQYGDTWVVGNWTATGRNERGGLTMQKGGMYSVQPTPETCLLKDSRLQPRSHRHRIPPRRDQESQQYQGRRFSRRHHRHHHPGPRILRSATLDQGLRDQIQLHHRKNNGPRLGRNLQRSHGGQLQREQLVAQLIHLVRDSQPYRQGIERPESGISARNPRRRRSY